MTALTLVDRPRASVVSPGTGRCRVLGVLNVTPDSFSDGGRYLDLDATLTEPSLGLGDQGIRTLLESERLRGGLDRGHPGPDLLDALDASVCTQQATSAELSNVLSPLRYPWDGSAACE